MIHIADNRVILTGKFAFDPAQTFSCGQSFRFLPEDDGFSGVAGGRALFVSRNGEETVLHCSAADFTAFWRVYFDLDRDYAALRALAMGDAFLSEAAEFGKGIRILRQEPFETLCSFIFSQCNHIPRIMGLVENTALHFGASALPRNAFPEAEDLAALSLEDLAPLKAGYRAPYLLSAAKAVASGALDLNALADPALPLSEARNALMALPGVGRKVADCVLLFGLGRMDAFPVDVWMRRALETYYPSGFPYEKYQTAAGLFQQYIFFYVRHLHKTA